MNGDEKGGGRERKGGMKGPSPFPPKRRQLRAGGHGSEGGRGHQGARIAAVSIGLIVGMLFGYLAVEIPSSLSVGTGGGIRERIPGTGEGDLGGRKVAAGNAPSTQVKAAEDASQIGAGREKGAIHTIITTNGSPYVNWQTRLMYGSHKRMQKLPGGSAFKYFTRILSRKTFDNLMTEVPTVRVDPLNPACDSWCAFPVADRPHAIAEWLKTEDSGKAEWILCLESDYLWVKPLPPPFVSKAFWYGNINPSMFKADLAPYFSGSMAQVPHTGPAPVLMTADEWHRMIGSYERITNALEHDDNAVAKLGWLREMYTFSLAAAAEGIQLDVEKDEVTTLIAQPPASKALGKASLYHYTWSCQVLRNGVRHFSKSDDIVWQFEKRKFLGMDDYVHIKPLELPPPSLYSNESLSLVFPGADKFTKRLAETMSHMLGIMNEIIDDLPPLEKCGWDGLPMCDESGNIDADNTAVWSG